jgi:[ribosomal protein S18]-alanine N-acetyltransferase
MISIRAATAADLPQMMEIATHAATAAQWDQTEYQKLFAAEAEKNRTALVIEEDGAVEGFIIARQAGPEWEIENIAIAGQARRRGLGTRLVGEFIDLTKSHGGEAVFLEVRESNVAARMLYEKWAFEEAGRRKGYYRAPDEDAIIFRLSLR